MALSLQCFQKLCLQGCILKQPFLKKVGKYFLVIFLSLPHSVLVCCLLVLKLIWSFRLLDSGRPKVLGLGDTRTKSSFMYFIDPYIPSHSNTLDPDTSLELFILQSNIMSQRLLSVSVQCLSCDL